MVNRSRLIHSDLAEEMIWTAVEQFMPAAVAGAAITAVLFLFAPETVWMAPGLWQITFGLGVFASVRFLPRALMLVGAWYLACGLVCLALARAGHAFTPWAMGVPFRRRPVADRHHPATQWPGDPWRSLTPPAKAGSPMTASTASSTSARGWACSPRSSPTRKALSSATCAGSAG